MFTQQCQRSGFVNRIKDSHAIRFRCKNQTNPRLLLSIRKYCNENWTKARLFQRTRHFIFFPRRVSLLSNKNHTPQCNIRVNTFDSYHVRIFFPFLRLLYVTYVYFRSQNVPTLVFRPIVAEIWMKLRHNAVVYIGFWSWKFQLITFDSDSRFSLFLKFI